MAILIIDDERAIREMICLALSSEGYECTEASDAHKANAIIKQNKPDLILLDWMMPGISGINFAQQLKKSEETRYIPIIMLTAKTEEDDMVRGLDSGVDDYISKPFSTRELLARIRSLLRRSKPQNPQNQINISGITLDIAAQRAKGNNANLTLGPTEFKLLQFFMQHPDRVFSREQILNRVWGHNVYVEERTVDVHIRRLRKILEETNHHTLIQTIRGRGYRFSEHI